MDAVSFVTSLAKNIVTSKNDVVIDSLEEVKLGDSAKHFLSVPSVITAKGRYLHHDASFEISFFVKKRLNNPFVYKTELKTLFRNEKFVYEKLFPTLEMVSGVELPRPKFYGASEDYVLLQDLVAGGYRSINMVVGANLEQTKFILRKLAYFHVSSLKLKLDQPEEFASMTESMPPSFIARWLDPFNKMFNEAINPAFDALSSGGLTKLSNYIQEKRLLTFDTLLNFYTGRAEDDSLNLFIHGDTKSDNMMVLFEDTEVGHPPKPAGKLTDFKFIDFQTVRVNSVLSDVILFLGTSVNSAIFKSDFEGLLKFYSDEFIAACNQMGIVSPPTWDSFWEELHRISGHALVALVWYLPIHSMECNAGVDWSSPHVEAMMRDFKRSDRSLYNAKLCIYAQTLSKYFMKFP